MQATMFGAFGLLMVLLMKKNKPKLKINSQVEITIQPHPDYRPHTHIYQKEHYQPQPNLPKKKAKKNKRVNRMQTFQNVSYPRHSYTQEMIIEDWLKKQQKTKMKCQYVGRQIQALTSYFIDALQAKIPYNGTTGVYKLNIIIPGSSYSDIPIDIHFTQAYPFELPQIQVKTNNLHPLQKQKLFQIMNQHQSLFEKSQSEHLPNKNMAESDVRDLENSKKIDEDYLQIYYPYVFNLCAAISQQLFYKFEPPVQNEENNKKITSQNTQPTITKINKIKEQMQANKQIYQDFLDEVFNHQQNQINNKSEPQKQKQYNMKHRPNVRGRYNTDYQQLQMIGEGGFGRVYKCKNRVDSNIYAVKKLVINYNDPQSRKLLKEVALLSKLNHPNIVRYHQSWLEDTSTVDELITDMSISDIEQIQQFKKIWKNYAIEHQSRQQESGSQSDDRSTDKHQFQIDQDSVIFGEDIIFQADYSSYVDQKKDQNRGFNYGEDSDSGINVSQELAVNMRKNSQKHEFPFKILYILMEYCGKMTLKDFINKRFNQPIEDKIKLIRGILQGLSYIHSKRIMHRDLKPANIFLIENTNKVKIGDFGLATIGNAQSNPLEAEIVEYSEKTRGVGTSFYRAPQQLHSSHYDQKIDLYSLGIIMLELLYQFDTSMQRNHVLTEVTKTHKLPKDFNKVEHHTQFQQQIQSCLSVRPVDRPSVQKLLQTFRNKYFTQFVSLIASPKHFQFYRLMNHLFGIKNQSSVLMKQNLFRNYLTQQFTHIYQIHRGVLFAPLSLIPVNDFDTLNGIKIQSSRKQKFLALSERGVVMEFPSNAYVSWIRYARETIKRSIKSEPTDYYKQQYFEDNKELRRYTFEKVAEFIGGDLKSEFSFKQKYVTAFDICYSMQNGFNYFFLCEILRITLLMIETMDLTQKNPPLFLCHSLIFKCIALEYNVSLVNMHRFLLSTTDDKFRTMKHHLKIEHMKSFGLQGNIAKRIIFLLEEDFEDIQSFLNTLKNNTAVVNGSVKQVLHINQKIQIQIRSVDELLKVFGLIQRVKWKVQIPIAGTFGLFWNAGPVKGFVSVQQYLPGQELCNLHIETSLIPSSEQSEADVSVWSNGEFLQNDILEIISKCWENDIAVKWYRESLGEKDETCRHNIILKKKNDRVYMMLRKNHIGFERKLSKEEEARQEKERSFMLKEYFNYEVLKNQIKESHKRLGVTH